MPQLLSIRLARNSYLLPKIFWVGGLLLFLLSSSKAQDFTEDYALSLRPACPLFYFPNTPLLFPALLSYQKNTPPSHFLPTELSLSSKSTEQEKSPTPQKHSWSVGTWAHLGFIHENKQVGGSAVWRYKRNALGIQYAYEGFPLFYTHSVGLSYSRAFLPNLSAGFSCIYKQNAPIEQKRGASDLEIGLSLLYSPSRWDFGFNASYLLPIYGFEKGLWNKALFLQIMAACRINQNLTLGLDISKDLRYPLDAKASISYLIASHFLVSASCGAYPLRCSLGAGYAAKNFSLYVSASYHSPLGATGQLSFGYRWF